jgi:hypothetical protein
VYCAASVEPVYSKADAIADSAIVGVWRSPGDTIAADSTVIERASPSNSADKEYLLTMYSSDGIEREDLYLTRIGGLVFADVYPTKENDSWNSIPLHAIFLGRPERDRITIHAIDAQWLQKYSATHPKEIRVETIKSIVFFHDSTARVRSFLANHQNSGLWDADSMVLVRAPVPGTR